MTSLANLEAAYAVFNALPDAAKQAGGEMLHEIGIEAQKVQEALTPVDTGTLKAANTIAEAIQTLRVRVGYPQLKSRRSSIWYAIIVEYGRRAGSKQVQRRRKSGGKLLSRKRPENIAATYTARWSALPARPFVHVDDKLDAIVAAYAERFQNEVLAKVGAA